MSEDLQRVMREPLPASQPPSGQRFVPEQFAYIPGQERSLHYSQPNTDPQHFHCPTASPMTTGSYSRPHGSLLPPLPPPVKHYSLSAPPPHLHSHPPPMFSRPPPQVLPRFSQPPPAMPHTPNIPHQAAFQGPLMMAPGEGNVMWHRHNPPSASPCSQVLGDRGPAPNIHLSSKGSLDMGQEEQEDLRWLEEFERKVKSCPSPSPTESTTISTRKNVKLAEVQRLLMESYLLKGKLCGLEKKLSDTQDEEEWDQLVKQAEAIKLSLNKILDTFQDQGFVERTKLLLMQRRAKRNRVKRRKKAIQLEKEQLRRKREEEEAVIDAWRAKLRREEESKRKEEAVKREADSILGEVRHKQSEGQRMLKLLEALAILRHVRTTQAAAQGQVKDTQAEHRFTTTTKMIADIVKQQLKEYELEEQTLRVMMEESASHRSAALSVKRDATFVRFEDAVRKLLFGPTATADAHGDAELSLETLIQRRQEWDQFVVKGDSLLASAVPLSWVLPPAQPDSCWAAFLKR